MSWTIMTPDETVSWNGENLIFSEGVPQKLVLEDNVEQLWCTYYRAIFNPARVKLKAMRNEMPIRYWHTLPETQFIPQLIQDAPARAGKMLRENEGLRYSAKHFFTEEMNLAALEQAAAQCKACNLYVCAKQTVFGSGSPQSKIMIIGEQPGLQEDKQGIPFVGPAGLLLREILHEIKFPLETLYFTNAVKHFKHSVISGKRIHRSPDIREVNACKPWVEKQISLINPKIIICLGNTAGRALINPGFSVTKNRGQWQEYQSRHIIGTYHPSAILRVPDVAKKIAMRQDLKNDLLMGLKKFSE